MLEESGYHVATASCYDQAIGRIEERVPHAVLLDRQLEDEDGLEVIGPLRKRLPNTPVILVTANSSTEIAVRAIKLGAYDFINKPLDEARLYTTLTNAIDRGSLLERLDGADIDGEAFEGMIGRSPAMQTVFSIIKSVAPTDVSVLICGDSGTGKELIAQAIHNRSNRSEGPFVPINMATLPAELVESTLYGHERGAFTGADSARIGACEEAQNGTLFLDEVTEMPIELQAKLLRFLQEKTFRRVGGSKDYSADLRIVSATNRDPLEAISSGKLREDLYYRLNVVPIDVPTLAERSGDLPLLVEHAIGFFAKQYNKQISMIADDAIQYLASQPWLGNVRQLMHTIERAIVLNDGTTLTLEMLGQVKRGTDRPGHNQQERDHVGATVLNASLFSGSHIVPLEELERMAIEHALAVCNGSPSEAASHLGISSATIYRKIKTYKLKQVVA